MEHKALSQIVERMDLAKEDSDTAYFISLLCYGEALLKTLTAAMIAAIGDDQDRNRYRLEHSLIRASGIGDWGRALDDCLIGTASQFLLPEARSDRNELTKKVGSGEWQYDATVALKETLNSLDILSEEVPTKTSFQRWALLFATLRNKTRGHGALVADKCSAASEILRESLSLVGENASVLGRPWVFLHQNLSGKYRVSPIAGDTSCFDHYKTITNENLKNGIYIHFGEPAKVPLIETTAELRDFYFVNGGLTKKKYDLISYSTGNTQDGEAANYSTPPGQLPASETEGARELDAQGNCFSNVPPSARDYVNRDELEQELLELLRNDRHPVITLVGRGGIGKTSLALATLSQLTNSDRFEAIVWFSARDIDLHETGPKPVRPDVLTQKDVSDFFATLVAPPEKNENEFSSVDYLQNALGDSPIGPTLFVFDNFETTANPGELYSWIDTYIRNPNKVLITTRLREFKGDYPVEVRGMTEDQCRELIEQTSGSLGISHLLSDSYINTLITESQGHPYVLKVLLGEVAKEKREVDVRRLVAGSEEILIALFERTYGALNEAARRVFLTLASWNSAIPQIALEAILLRPENERADIGEAIDSLVKSSMVELMDPGNGETLSVSLPLVAREFGRKKLNVSPMRTAIFADREILQMLGVDQGGPKGQIALDSRLERFVQSIATRVDEGVGRFEDYRSILEMIARNHNPTWLLIARFYEEIGGLQNLERAKEAYRRFLENDPQGSQAAAAWRQLAYLAHQTGDVGEELNAFVERSQVPGLAFSELSNTVNRFNEALHRGDLQLSKDERRIIGERLLKALEGRKAEASGEDFSRLAWLALNLDDPKKAAEFVKEGIARGGTSLHLQKLQKRLAI